MYCFSSLLPLDMVVSSLETYASQYRSIIDHLPLLHRGLRENINLELDKYLLEHKHPKRFEVWT